jgi:Cft2 family RNA processing exonuclease
VLDIQDPLQGVAEVSDERDDLTTTSDAPPAGGRNVNVDSDIAARAADLREHLAKFQPDTPAPDEIPDTVLRHIAVLPAAKSAWRTGLDRSTQRRLLIRAGVTRKANYGPSSQTARALAQLLRRERTLWDIALQSVLHHHDNRKARIADATLVALADDPAAFLDSRSACPEEFVAAAVYMLHTSDREELELIEDELAERLAARGGDRTEDEDAERHRIHGLEELVKALERDIKDRDKHLAAAEKKVGTLEASLNELETAQQRAGDADAQLAGARAKLAENAKRIASLDGQLSAAKADRERLRELEERAGEMDSLQADLDELRSERDGERRLRLEAQEQADRQAERLRQISQSQRARPTGPEELLPVDSPRSLFRALAPVVGQATSMAAERITSGAALPDDQHLLRLTAVFSELSQAVTPVPAVADGAAEIPVAKVAEIAAPEIDEATPQPPDSAAEEAATTADRSELAEASRPRRRRTRRHSQPFRIRALGGAEEVGGSAILVQTHNGYSVLLDAGQRVKGEYGDPNAQPFHFRVPTEALDGVLISHAHVDHVGSLPTILGALEATSERDVPVWMSPPTIQLAEIMLLDSAKIQHSREERMTAMAVSESDYYEGSMRPAYTQQDVKNIMERVRPAEKGAKFRVGDTTLLVRYLPVAHVLGSCAIHVTEEESGHTLLYTGDLGPIADPQHTLPTWGLDEIELADLVIMESTYGVPDQMLQQGRRNLHGREQAAQRLSDYAMKTVGEGGFLLLPSFSLGRTQELVKIIEARRGREMPDGPLYVAGMGNKIMDVYDQYSQARNGGWAAIGSFPSVRNPNEWLSNGGTLDEAILDILSSEKPGYIIASPAMLSGGWSRAFLREMVRHKQHGVVFTGYMPRAAGGIPGINRLKAGDTLRLGDENPKIKCLFQRVGLSAHAPTPDLHAFAERMTRAHDATVFGIVHGEAAAQRELATWVDQNLKDQHATAHSLQRQTPWVPELAG